MHTKDVSKEKEEIARILRSLFSPFKHSRMHASLPYHTQRDIFNVEGKEKKAQCCVVVKSVACFCTARHSSYHPTRLCFKLELFGVQH